MNKLITDLDLEYVYDKDNPGLPLVWVVDGKCLHDMSLSAEYAEAFLSASETVDISSDYPDYDGIVVRLLKNSETVLELKTSEHFGNILLSNPQVLSLLDYPYGMYVESPDAEFDGEKFILTKRSMIELRPWHLKQNKD